MHKAFGKLCYSDRNFSIRVLMEIKIIKNTSKLSNYFNFNRE